MDILDTFWISLDTLIFGEFYLLFTNVVIWLTPLKGVVTEFGLSHVFDIKVGYQIEERKKR